MLYQYDFIPLLGEDSMHTQSSKELHRYNYLSSEIDAAYHELSSALGLADSSMIVLYTICDNGDCCLLQDICRKSGISKQTVNSALRKLEAADIVYLENAGPKSKRVCLTEQGRQLAGQTAARIIEVENRIFSSWEIGDVEKYLELTERYLNDFKERSKEITASRQKN